MSSSTKSSTTPAKKTVSGKSTTKKVTETPVNKAVDETKKQPTDTKKTNTRKKTEVEPEVEPEVSKDESTADKNVTGTNENSNMPSQMLVEKYIKELLSRKREEGKRLREEMQMLRDTLIAYNKQMRDMKKNKKTRQANKGNVNKKPSGFAQSAPVKDELCEFLGLEPGSSIARTEVTQKVIKYVKDNNLEEPNNKRYIIPDDALEKIVGSEEVRLKTMQDYKLKLEERVKHLTEGTKAYDDAVKKANKCVVTEKLGYFNIQIHISPHFHKKAKTAKVESVPEVQVAAA